MPSPKSASISRLAATDDTTVTRAHISGGEFTRYLYLNKSAVVDVSGGTFSQYFQAREGAVVNLIGADFVLDGVPLSGLAPGQSIVIDQRDVTLEGVLADGSAFSFDLNSAGIIEQDMFSPDALLTITVVPAPAVIVLVPLPLAARRRR